MSTSGIRPAETRIRSRDVMIFVAVSNVHYPILELLRSQYSYGLAPIQFALIAGLALLAMRAAFMWTSLLYIALSIMYFFSLSTLNVGFPLLGAYVVVMQTATALAFIDYVLWLGQDDAQALIANLQKLLGGYIVVFAIVVLLVRASGDLVLFNQVAGLNYFGVLTTYVILNIMRRRRIGARGWLMTGVAIAVNFLGEQRSSLLINLVTGLRRTLARRFALAVVATAVLSITYLVAGAKIDAALSPVWALASTYRALVPLGFAELQDVTRYAVVTPDAGYDPSLLLRVFSMVFVASEVIRQPWLPVFGGDPGYFSVSHNLLLEYFKVGGLAFVVLSGTMLFSRYRQLLRRGYFALDPFGVLITVVYSLLFNDLFLGFLLMPLALRIGGPDLLPERAVPAASPGVGTPLSHGTSTT